MTTLRADTPKHAPADDWLFLDIVGVGTFFGGDDASELRSALAATLRARSLGTGLTA